VEIEILQEERLRHWCAWLDLPAAAVDELASMARSVRADETLGDIFAAFHQKTAVQGEWDHSWSPLPLKALRSPDEDVLVQMTLGRRAALFYLLAYLAALPYAEAEYRRRGIDLAILRTTLGDIRTWLLHEYELSGVWTFRQFMWIWRHLNCKLFRLGRLQYILEPFEGGIHAFQRRANGEICLLADPDVPLRADGCTLAAGRSRPGDPFYRAGAVPVPEEAGWLPTFAARADGWQGYPVSPYGQALKDSVFLPAAEWEQVLQRGDTVLELHIPRKDPFSVADCRDSLAQAFEFFKTCFPERPFRAAACHTWFFTPQLQRLLPPESNIVRFQREFSLYPYPGSPAFLWSYVFGEKVTALAGAPRDTALRRSVLDWLEAGGELFDLAGVMFHGPQQWGSQPYMRRWDEQQRM
jgi:hypothetical protein